MSIESSTSSIQNGAAAVLGSDFYLVKLHHLIQPFININYFVLICVQVKQNKRAGQLLLVYARNSLRGEISKVESSAENTGFLKVFPNKGALCTSLRLRGTRLSFVSCHLAAHEGFQRCQMRNESIKEILAGIHSTGRDNCTSSIRQVQTLDPSLTAHHMFWLGDLNYRVAFDPETPGSGAGVTECPSSADMIRNTKFDQWVPEGGGENNEYVEAEDDDNQLEKSDVGSNNSKFVLRTVRELSFHKIFTLICYCSWAVRQ